jgi:hypothetical protein
MAEEIKEIRNESLFPYLILNAKWQCYFCLIIKNKRDLGASAILDLERDLREAGWRSIADSKEKSRLACPSCAFISPGTRELIAKEARKKYQK